MVVFLDFKFVSQVSHWVHIGANYILRKLQLWNISYMLYFYYTHATMLTNHAYDHYGSLQILG